MMDRPSAALAAAPQDKTSMPCGPTAKVVGGLDAPCPCVGRVSLSNFGLQLRLWIPHNASHHAEWGCPTLIETPPLFGFGRNERRSDHCSLQ